MFVSTSEMHLNYLFIGLFLLASLKPSISTRLPAGSATSTDQSKSARIASIPQLKERIARMAFQHRKDIGIDSLFSPESFVKRIVLEFYDKTSRPVVNDSDSVQVQVGISLFHILDTNEKAQTISTLLAIRLEWTDINLRWEPKKYKGVERIWLPAELIWTPDIVISNNADQQFASSVRTNAVVDYNGGVLWMYPTVVTTYCTLDVRYFPFDTQFCEVKFISWTYTGFEVNLTTDNTLKADGTPKNVAIYFKETNQEWSVKNITAVRDEKYYACCDEPFPDVTFTLGISRRSTFYVFNLVFPCFLMYCISLLGFYLPVESNDKVNLEITILLAMVVFLMVIAESLPPTPDAIPLLGMFFGLTMLMVSVALVMAVVVTNIYYRKDTGERVPGWIRVYVLRCCPGEQGGSFLCCVFGKPRPKIKDRVPMSWLGSPSVRRQYAAADLEPVISADDTIPCNGPVAANGGIIQVDEQGQPTPRTRTARSRRSQVVHSRQGEHSCSYCAFEQPLSSLTGAGRHEHVGVCRAHLSNAPQGSMTPNRPRIAGINHSLSEHMRTEWKLLATKLDRLFWWFFVAISVSVQVLLLIQIPSDKT